MNRLLYDSLEVEHDLALLNDSVSESLAELVPVLLCGEQSAVTVFHHEVHRLSIAAKIHSTKLFTEIEQDEMDHEECLQKLLLYLPESQGKAQNLRHSRLFYVDLSRSETVAQHFSRIMQLDRAVCQIMDTISKSIIAQHPRLKALFSDIKKDEAKHSFLCRRHAISIGATKQLIEQEKQWVIPRLIGLISPHGDAFENLKVDTDLLFKKLQKNTNASQG